MPRDMLPCTLPLRSTSAATLPQPEVKCRATTTQTGGRGQPSSQISPVEPRGEKNADASCCYLQMRHSVGWNDTLDGGLWEDIGFSSGTQFLEGMIDAHLRSSVLIVLARLWPCSCHTVDMAGEKATLKLQTGLNGPSLSCRCFLTKVSLSAHHKLLPEMLADWAAEKLPFVCLWFWLCTKSPIVGGYF